MQRQHSLLKADSANNFAKSALIEVIDMLNGTPASDGIGIGKVLIIEEHSLEYTPKTVGDTDAESSDSERC